MKKNKNSETLKEMEEIYYPNMQIGDSKYLDWMGFEINYENKPSYHHIVKYSHQKSEKLAEKTTIENGAYLGEYSHIALHQIEKVDIYLYNRWNNLFKGTKYRPIDIPTALWLWSRNGFIELNDFIVSD